MVTRRGGPHGAPRLARRTTYSWFMESAASDRSKMMLLPSGPQAECCSSAGLVATGSVLMPSAETMKTSR